MTRQLQSPIYYGVDQPRSYRRKVVVKGRRTDLHYCTDLTVLKVSVWRRMIGRVKRLDRRRGVETDGMGGEINGQRCVGPRARQRRHVKSFLAGRLRGRQRGLAHWIDQRRLNPLE